MVPRQGMVVAALTALAVVAYRSVRRAHAHRQETVSGHDRDRFRAHLKASLEPRVKQLEKIAAAERRHELRHDRGRLAELAEKAGVDAPWHDLPTDDTSRS